MHLGSLGLETKRTPIVLDRLVKLSLSLERIREIVVRLGQVRLARQRLPILRHRLLQLILILECCGKTEVSLDTFGIDGQSAFILGHGVIQPAQRPQSVAESKSRLELARLQG